MGCGICAPTVSRQFRVGEELALLAEVYDNDPKTPHTVDITTLLQSDDGRVVYSHEDQRSSKELGGSIGGYGHQAFDGGRRIERRPDQRELRQREIARVPRHFRVAHPNDAVYVERLVEPVVPEIPDVH